MGTSLGVDATVRRYASALLRSATRAGAVECRSAGWQAASSPLRRHTGQIVPPSKCMRSSIRSRAERLQSDRSRHRTCPWFACRCRGRAAATLAAFAVRTRDEGGLGHTTVWSRLCQRRHNSTGRGRSALLVESAAVVGPDTIHPSCAPVDRVLNPGSQPHSGASWNATQIPLGPCVVRVRGAKSGFFSHSFTTQAGDISASTWQISSTDPVHSAISRAGGPVLFTSVAS
jgi:hypothetical protein